MKNKETIINKKITYQESDFMGHYRLANLFSMLSDLATKNAVEVGIWKEELQLRYGWILTKQTMKLDRPIHINEDISFSTRAGKSSRIQFTRLYDFYDAENICIGGVYSTWTFIDIEKRKITRPDKVGVMIPEIEEYPHRVESYTEIENNISLACKATREVVYSDVDVNQHMNNYRYIEWAMDVMNYSIFTTHYLREVSMIFKKEMSPGTKAKVLYGEKDQYFKVRVVSEDETIVHFEMGGYFEKISK